MSERVRLPPADLLSHAGSDQYWIVQVLPRTPVPGRPGVAEPLRSAVRSRQVSSGRGWQRVIVVQGRIIDLAHRGENAALLMEDGAWLVAWPSGSSTGPALPDGATIAAIGADDLSLWAVGVAAPVDNIAGVESPTTQPTAPRTTGAQLDRPGPAVGARLYVFAEAGWQPRASLPPEIPPEAPISLAVAGGKPMVAALLGPRRIGVARLDGDDNWGAVEVIDLGFDVRQFELFDQSPSPTLWIAGPVGAGEMRIRRGGQWSAGIPIEAGNVGGPGEPALSRSAEFFAGSVRFTWWDGKDLRERAFTLDGQPAGEAIVLGRTPPATPQPIGSGTLVLLGVLGALLALNIFRAEEEEDLELAGRAMRLAPLPRRMVAGLIDLAPIPAVMLWRLLPLIPSGAASGAELTEAMQSQSFALWMTAAVAFYLLHTTVLELATGKSVGKIACGLKIVALDGGGQPRAAAVLLRNVFRLVDLIPALPLALLILFSPLRQRLGDVVAGTVVIRDVPIESKREREQSEQTTAGR